MAGHRIKKGRREPIPDWKGWTVSHAGDGGRKIPEWLREIRHKNMEELIRRKPRWKGWLRAGVAGEHPVAAYNVGPVDLPLGFFTSSRWCERRPARLPLPLDRAGWWIAWQYWQGAGSYLGIKSHIEKYGMRRPIVADWFVNFKPGQLLCKAYVFRVSNPDWPHLILRAGNERLMMALFEWDWVTIPAMLRVVDCGHSPEFSAMLAELNKLPIPWLRRPRAVNRKHTDKGEL